MSFVASRMCTYSHDFKVCCTGQCAGHHFVGVTLALWTDTSVLSNTAPHFLVLN